ncbi:MAG: hypothetical protein U0176_15480 [Bacteroidia bacterium]
METFIAIETAEAEACRDMWRIAAPEYRAQFHMEENEGDGMTLLRMDFPPAHFNMALKVGLESGLTAEMLDSVLDWYKAKGPQEFMILSHPKLNEPAAQEMMKERGLAAVGSWDRIFRDASPLDEKHFAPKYEVVEVTEEFADAWAEFIIQAYNFGPLQPWLRRYMGARGWRHYVAMKHGKIAAARSFYTASNGWVWSGVEAPVPGFMTMDYDPDFEIWQRAIPDHIQAGAKGFVADIERVDDEQKLPSYREFLGHFGFQLPYRRLHWAFPR